MKEINLNKIATSVIKEIYRDPLKDRIPLVKYCELTFKKNYPRTSELERVDRLDILLTKIKKIINDRIESCRQQKIAPEYIFAKYPRDTLVNYNARYPEPELTVFLRRNKRKILEAINKHMDWKSFEHLCAFVLRENSIEPFALTKPNREGIDFYGLFDIDKYFKSDMIPKNCKMRVIGQARHYSRKIKQFQIRDFYTYCQQINENNEKQLRDLPFWFKRRESPVVGIFMTTSDFTKGCNDYAKGKLLILKNGEQIVEFIIKSPNSNKWVTDKFRRHCFNSKAFLSSFKG